MKISGFIGLDQFLGFLASITSIQVLFRVSILQKFEPIKLSYLELIAI